MLIGLRRRTKFRCTNKIDNFKALRKRKHFHVYFLLQAFEAQFTHGGLTVNEEDGSVQVSVRLNGQHERAVTIR